MELFFYLVGSFVFGMLLAGFSVSSWCGIRIMKAQAKAASKMVTWCPECQKEKAEAQLDAVRDMHLNIEEYLSGCNCEATLENPDHKDSCDTCEFGYKVLKDIQQALGKE